MWWSSVNPLMVVAWRVRPGVPGRGREGTSSYTWSTHRWYTGNAECDDYDDLQILPVEQTAAMECAQVAVARYSHAGSNQTFGFLLDSESRNVSIVQEPKGWGRAVFFPGSGVRMYLRKTQVLHSERFFASKIHDAPTCRWNFNNRGSEPFPRQTVRTCREGRDLFRCYC